MTQVKRKNTLSDNRTLIIVGVAILAVLVAAVAIILSMNAASNTTVRDYSQIPQNRTEDGAFVLGNPDAPVKIIAFEDFLCPACQAYKPTVDQFIEQYVETGLAQFEYRILPAVDPTYSEVAGELVACTDELGGSFWEGHDIMFQLASAERFSDRTPRQYAERVDIPYADLLECTSTNTQAQTDTALAGQYQAQGTPSVFYQYVGQAPVYLGANRGIETLGLIVESAPSQ